MVATGDVGRWLLSVLQDNGQATCVRRPEGPRSYFPHDIAAIFARLLNRSVRASNFRAAQTPGKRIPLRGMKNPSRETGLLEWLQTRGGSRSSMTHQVRIELDTVRRTLIDRRPMSPSHSSAASTSVVRSFLLSPSASGRDATESN